ncbi:hypothetical protein GCM10010912_54300 [Paenibacillus albidus]|uniref:DUF308 domain-containing protein n=1 Tax=Paenibacillus albidus TaxID=2041023 RepID=A0A917FRY5_9BACL|nr:DUF308 domain-containing protein [Paenibacillus albidus]GGG02634.1 hypothetical protein GCM10010912_54300 [Paenibacillus albidus]
MPFTPSSTSAGLSRLEQMLLWALISLAGLALGCFLPAIARWAAALSWIPFQGPLKLIASQEGLWLPILTGVLGLGGGLYLSHYVIKECLIAEVTGLEVAIRINGKEMTYDKSQLQACYLDGKELVLTGINGHELFREPMSSSSSRLASAFREHHFPWTEEDPYKDQFTLWVPDAPGLDPAVNALLKARKKALKKEETEDARAFRQELDRLGIAVRDEGIRQYWRSFTAENQKLR